MKNVKKILVKNSEFVLSELKKKSVGILYLNNNSKLTKKTYKDFIDILNKEKIQYKLIPIKKGLDICLPTIRKDIENVDIICKIIHGEVNRSGIIQGTLEELNKKSTGHTLKTDILSQDKLLCKNIMRTLKIPSPEYKIVAKENLPHIKKIIMNSNVKYILKPVFTNSSQGIFLPKSTEELKELINSFIINEEPYLMEEYIVGKIISIGIVPTYEGLVATPALEYVMDEKSEFMDSEWKKEPKRLAPANITQQTYLKAIAYSKKLHRAIGAKAMTRTDFIVDEKDNLYCLEINSNIGLSTDNDICIALSATGIDYKDIVMLTFFPIISESEEK